MVDPNPHLPSAPADLAPAHTRQHREECGPLFHQACLEFAQSLWLQGRPAQALLQLNKSSFAETDHPFPYAALLWFLENRHDDLFIGNPTRHFQHLATRMAGPRSEIRKWQAWACYHLSKKVLPTDQFSEDFEQQKTENLSPPTLETCLNQLTFLNSEKEASQFLAIFH